MRKFTEEIEKTLVKIEESINKDLKKGGTAFPAVDDRDDFSRELGVRDYRQLRAVIANAIKDCFSVKTHKYSELFEVINQLCHKYGHKDVVFKIERITRKRKPSMFTNDQLKKLVEGETVEISDKRKFKLVEVK